MPISTVYRLTTLLENRGLISSLGHDMGFAAGPICMKIALNIKTEAALLQLAQPVLQALALRTDESVALLIADGYEALCVDMYESSQAVRCSFSRGRSQPLLKGASAKALLAFQPDPVREAILQHFQQRSPLPVNLLADLQTIQQAGYATSSSEVDEGVWGASAPVFHGRHLQGVITLMAPIHRANQQTAHFIQEVITAAQAVSLSLSQTATLPTVST